MKLTIPAKKIMGPLESADPNQEIFCVARYYSPLFGWIYKRRLGMALELMKGKFYGNILDVGFGGGIFLPILKQKAKNLFEIDNHGHADFIRGIMGKIGVKVELKEGSVLNIPYENDKFDCIVCMSALEFVEDIDTAMKEISRVAGPNADIIIGAPIVSKLTDFCYRLVGKKNQNKSHKSGHHKIIGVAEKYFKVEKILTLPALLPVDYSLFFVLSAKNKK